MTALQSMTQCHTILTGFGSPQGSIQSQPESNFPPMQPADAVRYQSMFQQMDNDRDGYVQASHRSHQLRDSCCDHLYSTWQPCVHVLQ